MLAHAECMFDFTITHTCNCIYTCIHNAILHSFIVSEVQTDPKVSQYIKEKIEHVNENADKKTSHVKVTKQNYVFYNERAYKNAYFMYYIIIGVLKYRCWSNIPK